MNNILSQLAVPKTRATGEGGVCLRSTLHHFSDAVHRLKKLSANLISKHFHFTGEINQHAFAPLAINSRDPKKIYLNQTINYKLAGAS